MKFSKNEHGEVMLEGMIVMVVTMFTLVWILGIGFMYYQRYVTTAVANDTASKIAATFDDPTSDIVMGYVSAADINEKDLYRGFSESHFVEANKIKAEGYAKYMLEKTNFAGTIDEIDVEMRISNDSIVRRHVEITVTCTFNTPFGAGLELFGMDGQMKYSATGSADCTDIIEYISTIDFIKTQSSLGGLESKVLKSAVKMISSLVGFYNRQYN